MIDINGRSYPLCLLDTMVLSEIAKDRGALFRNFLEWSHSGEQPAIPCFTIYSLIELRHRPDVFDKFIERFRPLPCLLLKGYLQLIEDEVANYSDPSRVDPVGVTFTPLGGEGNQLGNLPLLLEFEDNPEKERIWNEARDSIVDGMAGLVPNYLPNGQKYTAEEVRQFVWTSSLAQLAYHVEDFVSARHDAGAAIDMDAFPSLKAMTYTVFHKFYADRHRKTHTSDAFDVLISSAVPYVDAVVTERHLADSLNKTKRRDSFLDGLAVVALPQLQAGVPATRT